MLRKIMMMMMMLLYTMMMTTMLNMMVNMMGMMMMVEQSRVCGAAWSTYRIKPSTWDQLQQSAWL